MADNGVLQHLVFTFLLGLVFVVALARARVPAIVALMAAGMVAGPSGIRIIKTPEEVEALAELGVVLLLFTVGLDFSLAAMKQIWRRVVVAGVMQMSITAALAALALVAYGRPLRLAIFVGLFVALSSTAIVIKGLADRNELASPHGRLMVGVLLLQDLSIVGLLLLVPILSGHMPLSAVGVAVGKALVAILAVAGASWLVLPLLLRIVTSSGRREAFPLAILVASIGTAWAASMLGLSMAIGAFLAGLMLAGGEFSHQAYAEIRGVRDILGALFFISLGMLLDLRFAVEHLPALIAIALGVIVVKSFASGLALMIARAPLRVAAAGALGLAQVGEFSFILARAGVESGLVPSRTFQMLVGASILTMVATPSLLGLAPVLAMRLRKRTAGSPADSGLHHEVSGHVIVLGFGVGGQLVARALRELRVHYIVLELNGATVRQARAAGERIMYGDAMSRESLEGVHVHRAAAIVSMMSDPAATERMVKTVRHVAPKLPIIVRTRFRVEADRLLKLGATVAVAEELEASLEVLAQLLARLHVAGNIIEPLLDIFRRELVAGIRPVRAPRPRFDALPDPIRRMPVATHQLHEGEWAVGRSLAEIDLRAATGASVLAIQSGDKYTTSPAADTRLSTGDILFMLGDESDIALARHRLAAGELA